MSGTKGRLTCIRPPVPAWHRAIGSLSIVLGATALVPAAHATEATYDCSGGTTLKAVFSPPSATTGRVTLSFASGPAITLPQTPSADGGRYAGKATVFWIKGRAATLTRSGATETCVAR